MYLGRALLFCPADRPERYEKALATADVVILDLEDAVAPDNKAAARDALIATPIDPMRVIVRVNAPGTPYYEADIEALGKTAYTQVMLAKTESSAQVEALAPLTVVALLETAKGILAAPEIVGASNLGAVMWGAEDLMVSLGGRRSRFADGTYRTVAKHARSSSLIATASAGLPSIDSVYLDIADLEGLAAESLDAAESGFQAKACIHPKQVEVVRNAYAPSADQVAWAKRVMAADTGGVFSLDGMMVDGPVLGQARQILRDAGELEG
jgi:citrate lyase subunit beta/citryl-CoA lyase